MAFPAGWTRQCAVVIDHTKVPANQTAFPVLLTQVNLPNEMVTAGGGNAAQSDGGDIRFSTDAAGSSQLPCEVVIWTQHATPSSARAEIYVPVDVLTSSDVTIYVWYNAGGGLSQPAANSSFGSQAVWTTDGHYKWVSHFGDGTTISVADSSGNNSPTNHGVTVAPTSKVGGAANFDASNYVDAGGTVTGSSTSITYEGWIYLTLDGAQQPIISNINSANPGGGIYLYCNTGSSNRNIAYFVAQNSALTWLLATQNNVYVISTWTHIVATVTGSTMALYVNGVALSSWAVNNPGPSGTPPLNLYIGNTAGTHTNWFLGYQDEVRVSDVARSANWITTLYNNQNTPSTFATAGTPSGTAPPADVTESVSDSIALSDAIVRSVDGVFSFLDSIALSDLIDVAATGPIENLIADDILSFADSAVASFGIKTPPSLRGNIDYDQIKASARSGDGSKLLTLKGSFVPGNTVVFDADGNLIDAGHS